MKVTIKDKEIELKLKFRSYMIYESITKSVFNPRTITDIIIFFYSVVTACNSDLEMTLDDFTDWLDDNDKCFNEFNEWITHTNNINDQYKESEDSSDTKKKTRKK